MIGDLKICLTQLKLYLLFSPFITKYPLFQILKIVTASANEGVPTCASKKFWPPTKSRFTIRKNVAGSARDLF